LAKWGLLWQNGLKINWEKFMELEPSVMKVPTYAFKKEKIWMEAPVQAGTDSSKAASNAVLLKKGNSTKEINRPIIDRKSQIREKLIALIQENTGLSVPSDSVSFFELGFDSLLLIQLAANIKQDFKVAVTFRQLNESLIDTGSLINYLHENLPTEIQPESIEQSNNFFDDQQIGENGQSVNPITVDQNVTNALGRTINELQILSGQLNTLSKQVELLNKTIVLKEDTENELIPKGEKIYDLASIEETSTKENVSTSKFAQSNETLSSENQASSLSFFSPPVRGAKIGKDENGNPAWFIRDPKRC
jgi:acyl carrier protein